VIRSVERIMIQIQLRFFPYGTPFVVGLEVRGKKIECPINRTILGD